MVALVSAPPVELQSGDIVDGRYQIIRQLADGGMGTVFLAEHVLIRRRVALKLLHAELAADGAMVRRFMNEATAAGMLGHPNIVESTDMGFTREGVPYIVFEYLEGRLLTEEVYRFGGLPVRRALQIASQIASAIEAAHLAQIAHLDLKSDNVFLIEKDESLDHVKVLDFGISRFLAAEADMTQHGILMGTPEFMAPEQIMTPDLVDGRADIYALGVLLYEMLTARRPHEHEDPHILLHRIVHAPPPALNRSIPPSLEHLLFDRMLAKSRDHRIQTMREVRVILDEIAFTVPPEVPEASPSAFDEPSGVMEIALAASPRRPAPAPCRPHQWWAVSGFLAGLVGIVLWYAQHQQATAISGDLLGYLRGVSWALCAALLAMYALGWFLVAVRTDHGTAHHSFMEHGTGRWPRRRGWRRLAVFRGFRA